MYFLLSRIQAGPGRTVKQEQEEISRNHVQAFIPGSVWNEPDRFCFVNIPWFKVYIIHSILEAPNLHGISCSLGAKF